MSPAKKGESALGKGLDALIRREKPIESDKDKETSGKKTSTGKTSPKKSINKPTKKFVKKSTKSPRDAKKVHKHRDDPNKMIIDGVILEVRKNPRISLWSARSAAVLRFLKNTKPAFSISKEASSLIEEAVQQKYPEIWEMFENEDF